VGQAWAISCSSPADYARLAAEMLGEVGGGALADDASAAAADQRTAVALGVDYKSPDPSRGGAIAAAS
jgi:hypothetical protein